MNILKYILKTFATLSTFTTFLQSCLLTKAPCVLQANIIKFESSFYTSMAGLAQLVRASGCGPEGHGFETHNSPQKA